VASFLFVVNALSEVLVMDGKCEIERASGSLLRKSFVSLQITCQAVSDSIGGRVSTHVSKAACQKQRVWIVETEVGR
jgi:hypothetical protein